MLLAFFAGINENHVGDADHIGGRPLGVRDIAFPSVDRWELRRSRDEWKRTVQITACCSAWDDIVLELKTGHDEVYAEVAERRKAGKVFNNPGRVMSGRDFKHFLSLEIVSPCG